MSVAQQTIKQFKSGTHNRLPNEVIPKDAAQDSLNWRTVEGRVELIGGRKAIGGLGEAGKNYGEHTGYRADGTEIRFRKVETKIQVLIDDVWTDVITGLTASDVTFSNYSSLAGAFVYVFSPDDGIFKIVTANPTSYISMYSEQRNFKGYGFIDKGRTIMWGVKKDLTGLYGSWIDGQDGVVYTTVTGESLGASGSTTYTGTLNIKEDDDRLLSTVFGLTAYAGYGSTLNIIAVGETGKGNGFVSTSAPHGYAVGDYVTFASVGGTTEINGLSAKIIEIVSNITFVIGLNVSTFGVYTSGGTVQQSEYFTDNFLGELASNKGGTGTINYATGVYTLDFVNTTSTTVFGEYQWEDSSVEGVVDFTKSATRLAGEGFVVRQDIGGDAIKLVLPLDGSYFSMKEQSCYQFTLDSTDLNPSNIIFRVDIGVKSLRSAISTSRGIVFMNTSNETDPNVEILYKSSTSDTFSTKPLFSQYKFADFGYEDALLDTWNEYVIIGCTKDSVENNRLLLCNVLRDTVDETYYGIRTSTRLGGLLQGGDPVSQTTYELFTGVDDVNNKILNYWESAADDYGRDIIKKAKRLRFMGGIDPNQSIQVWISLDDGDSQLVGTILGSGDYVDYNSSYAIGTNVVGADTVGGGDSIAAYPYFVEIKIKVPKYRKRSIKFVAKGYGYASVSRITDFDIFTYTDKMPSRYRVKQNVSLDGSTTDEANPSY